MDKTHSANNNTEPCEKTRLKSKVDGVVSPWRKWGPYVSERSWGTVREDYSANGDAWNYFPHEQARSKAYRWGEDGIAGWCDRYQILVFAPAFWNGADSILKERLFGLTPFEGNHGEDVKEYAYYLDGTPTHSYMKYLYKYPQAAYPYEQLKAENQKRTTADREYELIDTGVFAENRYFDIFIEYAKASPDDLCIKIEACNRGNTAAPLHIIPQLWFRNQWAWGDERLPEPQIVARSGGLVADDAALTSPTNLMFDYHLGKTYLYGEGELLFTNNETGEKEAFHQAIIHGKALPQQQGTKAALHNIYQVPANGSVILYLRLTNQPLECPLADVEAIVALRKQEADEFYATIHPEAATREEKLIQRQAFAGMLWNKQIYLFDVNLWLKGDRASYPPPYERLNARNIHWRHLNSMRILSMPDKWEYPWFASWDLAFHCLTLAHIDLELAKEQLWLLLFDQFQHPNGQIPAYEWEFSDKNPPVQAWVALQLYKLEEGKDLTFLKKCFDKLLMNFAWWVNNIDAMGFNVFEGGFLGLDNISLFDRSDTFPGGAKLQQSDGTGWMAHFCLNLMRMALELAKKDATYETLATKFFQHFAYIAGAMRKRDEIPFQVWNEEDGFFYDTLTYPNGTFTQFRVRSLVGLIPLYAVESLSQAELESYPEFYANFKWFLKNRQLLVENCVIPMGDSFVLSLVTEKQLKRVLAYLWDPEEFRAPFGLRSISKYHEKHPVVFENNTIGYEPAEAIHIVKGGNSNWRGPIWFPTTYLLIDCLYFFARYFEGNCQEIADTFSANLLSLFLPNAQGKRPFYGEFPLAKDAHWKDYLRFNEYFHPDTGEGLGASNQTGWTGLIANVIHNLRKKK